MSRSDDYASKYTCIRMRRENGILEMRFHTTMGRCAGVSGRTANCPMHSPMSRATAKTAL